MMAIEERGEREGEQLKTGPTDVFHKVSLY